jgi:hypothetical protein
MESLVRAPQVGDTVFVYVKMKSGEVTALSGWIEEISMKYVYFAMDCLELVDDPDTDGPPLQTRFWKDTETNLLRIGVRADQLKPFGGKLNEEIDCWEVRL